ncbi:MAG: glycosyltransferase [Candidatus Dormibacteraeota bacterium]|nr:glycosyltransferase [Candidatus Dormibacteraeota bacterium]
MAEAKVRVACFMSRGDQARPTGSLVWGRQVHERLLQSGCVELVEREVPNDAILSLDGRFRAGRGQPTVTAIVHAGHLLTRRAYTPREWLAQNWRVASAARRSTSVLVPSTAMRWALTARLRVPEQRVVVLEPLPGPSFRRSSRADLDGLRLRHRLPDRYFVYVGSRARRKNLGLLARVWAQVSAQLDPAIGLVLAGPRGGSLDGLPRVRDLGWVAEEELPALLSGAIAYLNPSLYEGHGLGPMEAMACGTPALVAATGALPRTVDQGGLLLDAQEPSQWQDAMLTLARRPDVRRELSANALKLMAERRAHPPDVGPLLRALGVPLAEESAACRPRGSRRR